MASSAAPETGAAKPAARHTHTLAVFGATGRSGVPLVKQALAAGHSVRVLVRNPDKLPVELRSKVTAVKGDVTDGDAVRRTVHGCTAVVSVIGHTAGSPPDLQVRATRNILSAMRAEGVRRLLDLTGAGVRSADDAPKCIDSCIVCLLRCCSPDVLKDGEEHVKVLQEEGKDVDWIVVRGPMLTEGPLTGKYRVGMVDSGSGSQVARADIAHFILENLDADDWVRRMPMLSYA